MNKERFHFRLGLFTVVGVVIAVVGIGYLTGGSWNRETFMAETYFDQSVAGLTIGAPVRHRGVEVGRVTKIGFVTSKYKVLPDATGGGRKNFNMSNMILVEMAINREAVRPLDAPDGSPRTSVAEMIKQGLRARLESSLLGGGGYIDTDFVNEAVRAPVPDLPWTPTDIYVPSQPSSAGQLIENLDRIASEIQKAHPGQLIANVNTLIVDANRLTKGLNTNDLQGRAVALLDQLKGASTSLQKILDDPHVAAILADSSQTLSNTKTLTDPKASDLAKLLVQVRGAVEQVKALVDDPSLKQAIANTGPLTGDARRLASRLAELVAGEREDLSELVRSLMAAASNIEAITADAKDNPARILFGAPPPKFTIHVSPEKQP